MVVAGGGLAGLAAAVRLTQGGARVTLLEQRRHLGGRAHSFADPKTGDPTDNGQHLFISAYHETWRFLETIGTAGCIRYQDRLSVQYRDPEHGTVWLDCPNLPAPLHLLAGMLKMKNLSTADKWALIKAGPTLLKLRKGTPPELDRITVAAWLGSLGQTPALRRAVWDPIVVATLNEDPETASAFLLGEVLRRGFLTTKKDSRLGFATCGLSELYVNPARRWLEERGATIETGVGVASVERENGRVRAIRLQSGGEVEADVFVLALSPKGLSRVVDASGLGDDEFFFRVREIGPSPIVSVNLWFDRPLDLGAPYVGLLDSPVQWVFDRRAIVGDESEEARGGRYPYALVTSAARELTDQLNPAIAETAIEEMRKHFPECREAKILHSSVVREMQATFSATPGFEALRCSQITPVEGLYLAGDWTDTKLPATIESAVESGFRAADAILGKHLPMRT